MSIARKAVGGFANASGSVTPVSPAFNAGDAIIAITGEGIGSATITTPTNWTALDVNTNAHQTRCFGHIAVSNQAAANPLDAIPTFAWGGTAQAWAIILIYTGLDASFTAAAGGGDRASNNVSDIIGPASTRTASVSGALLLFYGQRNKTSTTNGTVYTAPSGFSVAAQQAVSGTNVSVCVCEWIQGTPVTIPANTGISGSLNESATKPNQGALILLSPAASVFAPPPRYKPQTTYEPVYIYD